MRTTMKDFMNAINVFTENMISMFGPNTEEPNISIYGDSVEAKYWLHSCSDFNGISVTIEASAIKVRYHLVADGWQETTPDTIIGNAVKTDIDKILIVLNVEDDD